MRRTSPAKGHFFKFIRDSSGMICTIMMWLLIIYLDFMVMLVLLLPSRDFWYSVVNRVVFNLPGDACPVVLPEDHAHQPWGVPKGNAINEYMESLQLKPAN
ncbi:hypothetical protein J1605_001565 [Eschrichtius robustus]|uniref:Uncharacterized protein n=1 Tax=Eschrichtius robustus TaxID=9764 RepID=A0AB34I3D9_ESCRO|nr:hypothetical protein J1605_001565 [Eschrichtius robustus]